MKKVFSIIASIGVSCSYVPLLLTAAGNEVHAAEAIDTAFSIIQNTGEVALATDFKAIEQKLADFVKEKGYNANVIASDEKVVVSFKPQAVGETEYDAAAITQEIKTFCEENSLDFSAVKVIFQANDAAGNAATTDLKAIEQKLADFVKEKGYDATVTASEEDVAISFKQQAEGETEYDAAAITQEIKTFCENNALDFSAVKVIFRASGTGIADVAGDANCDGLCDVADAVLIARFAAEDREATMTDQGRKNADVTHDGNVDGQDAKKILQYIAKKITLEDLAK